MQKQDKKNKKHFGAGGVIELSYAGFSYSKISDFYILNNNKKLENGFSFTGYGKGSSNPDKERDFKDYLISVILLKSLIKIDKHLKTGKNEAEDDIYITRSFVRKDEDISIFFGGEGLNFNSENHTEYSMIDGIVGSVSCEFKGEELNGLVFSRSKRKTIVINDENNIKLRVNIQFYSKMDEVKGEAKSPHSYFTATMLTYGKIETFNRAVYCGMDDLYDFLLIDLLCKELEKATKKGIYKTYRQFYGNDDKLRGSVDVARHIRINSGMQNGKIAYRHRSNTINNYLSILLHKTYRYSKRKYPEIVKRKIDENANLYSFFQLLIYELDDEAISTHSAVMKNLRPVSHPYFSEYERVRKICLRILRNEGLSIFEQNRDEVSGFLYYLPDLWEDFLAYEVRTLLSRRFSSYELKEQVKEGFLTEFGDDNKFMFSSRPDFVFLNERSEYRMMLDAKMIPGMEEILSERFVAKNNYSEAINKCIRDMVVFGLSEVGTGVVFPIVYDEQTKEIQDNELREQLNNRWYKKSVRYIKEKNAAKFYFIPFVIPSSSLHSTYRDWKKEFDRFRNIFKEEMSEKLTEIFSELYDSRS